jgi:hypothetical protein
MPPRSRKTAQPEPDEDTVAATPEDDVATTPEVSAEPQDSDDPTTPEVSAEPQDSDDPGTPDDKTAAPDNDKKPERSDLQKADQPCPDCMPNGWPEGAFSVGCTHGTWVRDSA